MSEMHRIDMKSSKDTCCEKFFIGVNNCMYKVDPEVCSVFFENIAATTIFIIQ